MLYAFVLDGLIDCLVVDLVLGVDVVYDYLFGCG